MIAADIQAASSAQGNVLEVHLDVASESGWEQILERGSLDAVVACAGISEAHSIDATTLAEWRRVMAVNLDGVFLTVKYGARAIRKSAGGTIVVLGSASGIKAVPNAPAYCASKAAVAMLTKAAALELKPEGIRVNCVSPAGVATPMWKTMPFWSDLVAQHGGEEGAWNALGGVDPGKPSIQRMAFPEEIAEAVVFLSCDQSAHITGADLVVDGGYSAG